jgi:hypothetical protein
VIRDCFLKYNVEGILSACIVHRHYDLASNERNVESDGKAVASNDFDGLYPSSWMFFDGKCYPYEFTRNPGSQPPEDFVEEYGRVLKEAGMCDLIGFQYYTNGVVGLETTVDNVSTTVEQDMGPASWAFFTLEWQPRLKSIFGRRWRCCGRKLGKKFSYLMKPASNLSFSND